MISVPARHLLRYSYVQNTLLKKVVMAILARAGLDLGSLESQNALAVWKMYYHSVTHHGS